MKKYLIIIAIILSVFMGMLYYVFDFVFPKAEKFDFPDFGAVESITITKDRETISVKDEDAEIIYDYISRAKPTRKQSINENPTAVSYYTVSVKTDNISYFGCGHIYEQSGVTYYELPYVGIYTVDSDVLNYIESYFSE